MKIYWNRHSYPLSKLWALLFSTSIVEKVLSSIFSVQNYAMVLCGTRSKDLNNHAAVLGILQCSNIMFSHKILLSKEPDKCLSWALFPSCLNSTVSILFNKYSGLNLTFSYPSFHFYAFEIHSVVCCNYTDVTRQHCWLDC